MISEPGIYDISADDYHRKEICDSPSISNSGLKLISDCPLRYWWNSPLNPNRPQEEKKAHFNVGKAAHDRLLLSDRWPLHYHVTPEGYNRAATKKWADELAAEQVAIEDGKIVLSHSQNEAVIAMADALRRVPMAAASFRNGEPEKTLAWKDKETGVWLRVRPDFLPRAKRLIPDYKTASSANPKDFQRAIWDYGYHRQAALYIDGIEAITGQKPEAFYFVVQEKEAPYIVSIIGLQDTDIEWGRLQNRQAIRTFAECLAKDRWPAYTEEPVTVMLPVWAERELQQKYDAGMFPEHWEGAAA